MRFFLTGFCVTATLLVVWTLLRDASHAPSATLCALQGIGDTAVGQDMQLRLPLMTVTLGLSLWVMVRRRLWGWLLAMGVLAIITGSISGVEVFWAYHAVAAVGLTGCLSFWLPAIFALFLLNAGLLMIFLSFRGRKDKGAI